MLPGLVARQGGGRRRGGRLDGSHRVADIEHLLLQFTHLAGDVGHRFAQSAYVGGHLIQFGSYAYYRIHHALLLILKALLKFVLQQRNGCTGRVRGVERLLNQYLNLSKFLVLGALHRAQLLLQQSHVPRQFDNFFAGCEGQRRQQ